MKSMIRFLILLSLMIAAYSCNPTLTQYRFIYTPGEPAEEICRSLEILLEESFYNVDIVLVPGRGTEANLDSLAAGVADFTITENHVPRRDDIRSVLVFYPQILHIFYQGEPAGNLRELMYDKKIYIGKPGSGSYRLMMDLFSFFHLDVTRLHITDDHAASEVIAECRDLLSPEEVTAMDGYHMFSFGDIEHLGEGSAAEAVALRYPQVRPYLIPETMYGEITKKPVLTISSDAVLVARESQGVVAVTDLIKTIYANKQEFVHISPLIYGGLSESFDRDHLNFPLHEGARQYLERDEPSFFERYAELMGVSLSILIALISGIISLSRWQKQKKKDRIDVFYRSLMDIKNEVSELKTAAEGKMKVKEIQDLQNEAFELLINEQLEANESFRIFMELSKETIEEMRERMESIS